MNTLKALFATLATMACLAQALAQDQKVTFEAKAATADQILQSLSKAAGIRLTADSAMKREVLLISVKDVALKDLMDKIAAVTAGQWMAIGSEHRLVPDAGTRRKQQEALQKHALDAVKKAFDDLKNAGGDAPKTASALTLLAMQDPNAVAQLRPGDRIVFSSDPTASQMQVAGLTNDFVDSMMSQLAKNTEQAVDADHGDTTVVTVSDDDAAATKREPPAQVLLAVANKGGAISVDLMAFDAKGHKVAEENMGLAADFSPEPPQVPNDAPSISGPPSREVQRSDLTVTLWANGFYNDSAQAPNLGKEALSAVLQPEKFDPLSFIASEAILQRAHECGEQLVADLPDCIAFDSAGAGAEYLKTEIEAGKISLSDDKSWILISPGAPIASRIYRADRHALQELLATANTKGEVTLEQLAAFAIAEGHAPLRTNLEQDASEHYLHLLVPNYMNLDEGGNKLNALRVYGLLSGDQREALANGEPIAVGSLSNDAMDALRDIVYGADALFQVEVPPNPESGAVIQVPPPPISTFLEEPTLSMPDGIAPEAQIRMNQGEGSGNGELRLDFHLLPPLWIRIGFEGFKPVGG